MYTVYRYTRIQIVKWRPGALVLERSLADMATKLELITSITQYAPNYKNSDPTRVAAGARAAEAAGFDSALVGYASNRAEGWMIAAEALGATERLRALLAHRPGMMSPGLAARMASTLDIFCGGRLSLNIVSGGSAADQHREGDYAEHDERYERSIEYLDVMRRCWTEPEPFDFEGRFYKLEGVRHEVRPLQKPYIRLYMGGSSDPAMVLAEKHADVFMSWSEPRDAVRERFDAVSQRFSVAGREAPGLSVSMRLIIADSEEAAWARTQEIVSDEDAAAKAAARKLHSEDVGRNRQLQLAKDGLVHDERLWMGIAAATGGQGSTGALVGNPEQVKESLLEYVRAGATALLLTGPDGAYEEPPAGFLDDLRTSANEILAGAAPASAAS
jgi:alkanesulfonate monooxygenase